MAGVFVTGTGTDVGKTFVTAALVRHLRARGRAVDACKPVISGFDPANAAGSDSGILLAALGRPLVPAEFERISPWRFATPLSPDLAALAEGRKIVFADLVAFSQMAAEKTGTMLIEGVGGVMVPLDRSRTVLDWMTVLRLPVLVVAGSYLGTISHTLTALHVLAGRNLDIAGVIVSESAQPGAALADTVAAIARFAGSITVIGISRLPPDAASPPETLDAIVRLV
ncbi:MAG: dethiobiotin synthase [Hyphomicrobiales bacterium]|nr:dethiobiotin synthase [Hyphomicrobiales bacterium]